MVNHVGVVVKGGLISEAVIVEAVKRVRRIKLVQAYGPPSKVSVAVYRPVGIAPEQRELICFKALSYVGRKYGYLKIGAHLGDWFVSRLRGKNTYFFRRAAKMDDYPICSWVADEAYDAAGIDFGECPSPDDIWDRVAAAGSGFKQVRRLAPLGG